MTEAEAAAAQVQVLEIAAELEALIARLRAFYDGIPISPSEAVMLLGEEDMDVATALRSTTECVLADRLEPALVELRKWAAYKPPGKVAK
jgi:hypothetical protein